MLAIPANLGPITIGKIQQPRREKHIVPAAISTHNNTTYPFKLKKLSNPQIQSNQQNSTNHKKYNNSKLLQNSNFSPWELTFPSYEQNRNFVEGLQVKPLCYFVLYLTELVPRPLTKSLLLFFGFQSSSLSSLQQYRRIGCTI